MKNLLFSSIALLFMASCGDKVNFLSPQPENIDALTEIPKEYHGEFIIDGDTHIVTMNTIDGMSIIDDSVVVKERGSYFYVNRINKKGAQGPFSFYYSLNYFTFNRRFSRGWVLQLLL